MRGNQIENPSFNGNGIDATSPGAYLIVGNTVLAADGHSAIRIAGDGDPADTTPLVRRNTFGNSGTGIEVVDANPVLLENVMYWSSYGIRLVNSEAVIERNVIGDSPGIVVGDPKDLDLPFGDLAPSIAGNFISSSGEAISLARDAAPLIAGNVMCSDGEVIKSNEGANPTLAGNETYASTDSDVCPWRSDPLTYGPGPRQEVVIALIGEPE